MKKLRMGRKYSNKKIEWKNAPDIKKKVRVLLDSLQIEYVKSSRVFTYRSINANTRAYARIWGLSGLWQRVLDEEPAYILEVISEKFDKLDEHQQNEILLHEIAHIPKNFSGALAAHSHGKGAFHDKLKRFIVSYRETL